MRHRQSQRRKPSLQTKMNRTNMVLNMFFHINLTLVFSVQMLDGFQCADVRSNKIWRRIKVPWSMAWNTPCRWCLHRSCNNECWRQYERVWTVAIMNVEDNMDESGRKVRIVVCNYSCCFVVSKLWVVFFLVSNWSCVFELSTLCCALINPSYTI